MNKEGPRDFMRIMYKVAAESFNKQSMPDA